jgi:hypothetical protein
MRQIEEEEEFRHRHEGHGSHRGGSRRDHVVISTVVVAVGLFLLGMPFLKHQIAPGSGVLNAIGADIEAARDHVEEARDRAEANRDRVDVARDRVDVARERADAARDDDRERINHDRAESPRGRRDVARDRSDVARERVDTSHDRDRLAQERVDEHRDRAAVARVNATRDEIDRDQADHEQVERTHADRGRVDRDHADRDHADRGPVDRGRVNRGGVDRDREAVRRWLKENEDDPQPREIRWWPARKMTNSYDDRMQAVRDAADEDPRLAEQVQELEDDGPERICRLKYHSRNAAGQEITRDDYFALREGKAYLLAKDSSLAVAARKSFADGDGSP